jgi:hypothetical protein
MLIHGIEIQPDGHGKCGILLHYIDRSDLAQLPSSEFPLSQSDRTQYPALDLRQ